MNFWGKTLHNASYILKFEKCIAGWKKMTEGLSKRTAQYAGYLIIMKGSSK